MLYLWYTKPMAVMQKRKGSETRELILSFAESAVLEKGFAATSIDELIAAVGITKSGFFYHFKDKGDLAKSLLHRYIVNENAILDDLFDRADELNEDPLHGFLVGLKMLAELLADLPSTHPGCLIAAYCYQDRLFDQSVRDMNRDAVLGWRARFRKRLGDIAGKYPPAAGVDLDALADMVSSLVDGGIILSKAVQDKSILPGQVMLYREFVKMVFAGAPR